MDYMGLGNRIREERLRLNLSQAALGEAIDISDTYIGVGAKAGDGVGCNTISVSFSGVLLELKKINDARIIVPILIKVIPTFFLLDLLTLFLCDSALLSDETIFGSSLNTTPCSSKCLSSAAQYGHESRYL